MRCWEGPHNATVFERNRIAAPALQPLFFLNVQDIAAVAGTGQSVVVVTTGELCIAQDQAVSEDFCLAIIWNRLPLL